MGLGTVATRKVSHDARRILRANRDYTKKAKSEWDDRSDANRIVRCIEREAGVLSRNDNDGHPLTPPMGRRHEDTSNAGAHDVAANSFDLTWVHPDLRILERNPVRFARGATNEKICTGEDMRKN